MTNKQVKKKNTLTTALFSGEENKTMPEKELAMAIIERTEQSMSHSEGLPETTDNREATGEAFPTKPATSLSPEPFDPVRLVTPTRPQASDISRSDSEEIIQL